MVGERRRVILLTVDERPTSDKVLDWAINNMYRVRKLSRAAAWLLLQLQQLVTQQLFEPQQYFRQDL